MTARKKSEREKEFLKGEKRLKARNDNIREKGLNAGKVGKTWPAEKVLPNSTFF